MSRTDLELFKYSVGESGGQINSNYYPFDNDRFVLLCNDEQYEFWDELVEIIAPLLQQERIDLISISAYGEPPLRCKQLFEANTRHHFYAIEKSLIAVGGWASSFKNNGLKCGDKKPETMAKEILDAINVSHNITIETLLIGPSYGIDTIDLIPNFHFSPNNTIPKHIPVSIRCDLFENWKFVIDMSNHGYNLFVTVNKDVPIPVLPFIRNVKKINVYVNEGLSAEAVRNIEKSGIQYSLLAYEGGAINDLKMRFFDFNPINIVKNWGKNNLDKLKELPQTTHLKSSRILVCQEGNFSSIFHLKRGIKVNDPRGTQIMDGAEDLDFQRESDMFTYFKK